MMLRVHLRSYAQLTSQECNKDFQAHFPDDHCCSLFCDCCQLECHIMMTFRMRKLSDSQKSVNTLYCPLCVYRIYSDGSKRRGQKKQGMLLCAMLLAV